MDSAIALRLDGVRVTAAGLRSMLLAPPQGGDDARILDGVSLDVRRGEVLAILGESGGGKSTLLRAINRLIDIESGRVEVAGRDVVDWDVRELRRTAVYVPQRSYLFGGTVAEEATLACRWNGRRVGDEAVRAMLEAVDLDVVPGAPSSELSEGQRLRLCLARALLLEPEILLLDEPTGALDVRTSRRILAALESWVRERGATAIVVTHRPEDLETLGGEAVVLLDGRVAGRYAAADVAARRVDGDVAAFLGPPSGGGS